MLGKKIFREEIMKGIFQVLTVGTFSSLILLSVSLTGCLTISICTILFTYYLLRLYTEI